MPRRLWLSLAMLAIGGGLLATSALAGPAQRHGGVFRVGIEGASVQIDPQVAYVTTAWWLEYATAVKLYNWPDRPGLIGNRLIPEAAASFTVSNHGKTYTFFIRPGFRFSDGTPVTAKSFRYAFDRVANHDLSTPGVQFITDTSGTNIVGAKAASDGKAQHVSGVTAEGNRLIIRLTRPDSSFLTKLTMPFFQATSTKVPLTHEVTGAYPSAGPYRFTRNDVNVLTSIRRNPYYRGTRPHNLAGVDVQWNFKQGSTPTPDETSPSPDQIPAIVAKYGVNKSRFWAKPVNCVGWLVFNNNHGLFKNNISMRKAVNWAVDRKAYVAQAGPSAGFPWTHLLPPGSPGSVSTRRLQPYLPGPNLVKARKLATGHFMNRKITVAYRSTGTINPAQAQVVRDGLIKLGFKTENITMRPFYCEIGPCLGDNWDIQTSTGWCTDYPDPYDALRAFLAPNVFGDLPSLASFKYTAKLTAAARLVGNARYRAFGRLDLEIMNKLAPVAVMRTYNNRYFFSNRVDPRGLSYQAVYSDWSIPALALK
jgi:ABC-type oligopeptide transport system substrate-binding subunit